MRSVWPSFIKLVVYTTVVAVMTGVLVLIIVNGRTGETARYEAEFADVSGLVPNDNIKIAGVAVGKVTSVRVVGKGRARVAFDVDAAMKVPADVRVVVKYQNLIGDRYLDLQRTATSTAAGALEPGSVIPMDRTEPALNLTVLFGGFRPLFEALQPTEVNKFAEEVVMTLQGEGGTIESLLAHTASLTNTVADRDRVIGSLITDLNDVLGTVAGRDRQLSSLLVQLQRFVSGLSEDRAAIGSAVESVGTLTQSVSGLLDGVRGPLRRDIVQLGGLAADLDDGRQVISDQLAVLPKLLQRVNRTASYGAWFQFYLCELGGSVANGAKRSGITAFSNAAARCGR